MNLQIEFGLKEIDVNDENNENILEEKLNQEDILQEEKIDEKIKMSIQPIDALIHDDKDNIIAKYIEPDVTCICCNTP